MIFVLFERKILGASNMKVFIDANIYLDLVSNTSEQKIEYIENLLRDKQIKLVFPRITEEEILRRLPEVAKLFWEDHIEKKAPASSLLKLPVARLDPELKEIEEKRKAYMNKLGVLYKKYIQVIDDFKKRVISLRLQAFLTPETSDEVKASWERQLRGNPPGGNKIGDNLVWELLLKYCSDEELAIISNDPDWYDSFRSKKKKNFLNPLLEDEWSKNGKRITLYRSLGEFINKFTGRKTVSEEEIKKERFSTGLLSAMASLPGPTLSGVSSNYVANLGTVSASASATGPVGFSDLLGTAAKFQLKCNNCLFDLQFRPSYCPKCGAYNN